MNRTPNPRRAAVLAVSLIAALSCGFLAGCQGHDLPTESDLELRLDAAERIGAPEERDHALSLVATDAADQGDMGVTKRALERMANKATRNETAAECAVRLVKAGQRADGNQIAASITDPGSRSATFKRLAENDPGSTDPAAKGVKNYLGD